jgi:hypothetical protein
MLRAPAAFSRPDFDPDQEHNTDFQEERFASAGVVARTVLVGPSEVANGGDCEWCQSGAGQPPSADGGIVTSDPARRSLS